MVNRYGERLLARRSGAAPAFAGGLHAPYGGRPDRREVDLVPRRAADFGGAGGREHQELEGEHRAPVRARAPHICTRRAIRPGHDHYQRRA